MSAIGIGWRAETGAGLVQSFLRMAAFQTREEKGKKALALVSSSAGEKAF